MWTYSSTPSGPRSAGKPKITAESHSKHEVLSRVQVIRASHPAALALAAAKLARTQSSELPCLQNAGIRLVLR